MSIVQLVVSTISVIIGMGGLIVALVVAITNGKRAIKADQLRSDSDLREYTAKQTEAAILLGQIGKDVSDIKRDMNRFDEKLDIVSKDTFKNANDISTAWKRIDEIKKFVGFGEAGSYGK